MSGRLHAIGKFRHTVALCSQRDVVEDAQTLRLNRTEIRTFRAMIEPKAASAFSGPGASIEPQKMRTHKIAVRADPRLLVSTYAWLYERRRISAPRWFKILRVVETEDSGRRYFVFDCRLHEVGDTVPTPEPDTASPVVGKPDGVKL